MVNAVIVAGGSGVRMKTAVRKQYLPIARRPILSHTLDLFSDHPRIDRIILVVPKDDLGYVRTHILSHSPSDKPLMLVAGGKERQDSVFNGLAAIPETSGIAVIHDGVRPFVAPVLISRCIDKARETGACILGVPVSDTLKTITKDARISGTLSRKEIWLAQTPQAFSLEMIRKAHETARAEGIQGTDDAYLVERLGMQVAVILGSRENIKITSPEDLVLARGILMQYQRGKICLDDV